MSKLKEYMVPMRGHLQGTAFVNAENPEDARRKAARGESTYFENGETTDWELDGEPELNE